jgi:hypothetical protein
MFDMSILLLLFTFGIGPKIKAEFPRNENTNVDPFNSLQETASADFPLFLQAALLEAAVM